MISFLVVGNMCFTLMMLDVPSWMRTVASIAGSMCYFVAMILWEMTKDKINKKNGTERGDK